MRGTAALPFLEANLEIERRLENRSGVARSLFNLGYARLLVGNPPSARAHFEEGLKIFRKLGVGSRTAATRVATRRGLL